MKKIFTMAGIAVAASLGFMMASCATTSSAASTEAAVDRYADVPETTSTATGLAAIPADDLALASGIQDDEQGAIADFAAAQIAPWSSDGGKKYVQNTTVYIKAQNNGDGSEITERVLELVDVGGDDKVLAVNANLGGTARKTSIFWNISNQGNKAYDFSNKILKLRVYIPEELAYKNADDFNGEVRVQLRDQNWNQYTLTGDLGPFNFKDVGKGWTTLTFNFKDSTFDIGRKQGTFKVSPAPVKGAFAFELELTGKKVSSNLDVPFLIDWITLEDAE